MYIIKKRPNFLLLPNFQITYKKRTNRDIIKLHILYRIQ